VIDGAARFELVGSPGPGAVLERSVELARALAALGPQRVPEKTDP
jgi:hypothetical protein